MHNPDVRCWLVRQTLHISMFLRPCRCNSWVRWLVLRCHPRCHVGLITLPLVLLLVGQTVLMFIFSYFIVFNLMGRDYDAAVLSAGVCGFGMGATPNAMANMQVLCEKYVPSVKAYLLIPLIVSLFADFINSLVITLFINIL